MQACANSFASQTNTAAQPGSNTMANAKANTSLNTKANPNANPKAKLWLPNSCTESGMCKVLCHAGCDEGEKEELQILEDNVDPMFAKLCDSR